MKFIRVCLGYRAKDRLTIQEREREEKRAQQVEKEAQRNAEERRRQTLRIVEDEVRICYCHT